MTAINWGNHYSYKPVTSFTLARGRNELYVRFFVHGNCLRAVNSTDQSPVEEDSCVGLVLQNPTSGLLYDFAFNCIGICCAYSKSEDGKQLLDKGVLNRIRRFSDLLPRPFCEMEGMFHWQLVVAIPFSLIGVSTEAVPASLFGNFYKRADRTALPHFLSWKQIRSEDRDFAHPEYLGVLELE